MAASGNATLMFIDDVTHVASCETGNLEKKKRGHLIELGGTSSCSKTMTQNTLSTEQQTSSKDLDQSGHLTKLKKLKEENPQNKGQKEESNSLVMSVDQQLDAVTLGKRYATKY